MDRAGEYDEEKFSMVIAELQKVKSQIFYLQQSLIQLRAMELLQNGSNIQAIPGNSEMGNEIGQLKELVVQAKESCVQMNVFDEVLSEMEKREMELKARIQSNADKIGLIEEKSDDALTSRLEDSNVKLFELSNRLDDLEAESKKYNLIIYDLPPTKRLERPYHLESLVNTFFNTRLTLTEINFNEVERIPSKDSKIEPIRVKFPNIREKTQVLNKYREVSRGSDLDWSLAEEFTDKVKHDRRRLAAFARRKARVTKKKWALKYDQLYYNGRIFVFDAKQGRVVPKRID